MGDVPRRAGARGRQVLILLIDTQAAVWFFVPDPRLSLAAASRMRAATGLLISTASIWEANIKRTKHGDRRVGSLAPWLDRLASRGLPAPFSVLPIDLKDCYAIRDLAPIHGDPFDRMIAAQALRRELPVVSADPVFDAYGCERIW